MSHDTIGEIEKLSGIDLSVRVWNCLHYCESWNTIADLKMASDRDLLRMKNFGYMALRDLRRALDAIDISTTGWIPPSAWDWSI